jgi:nucleoside phosphorylase
VNYRSAVDILAEADQRGLRRAFIITALPLEMSAVRGHLKTLGSVADQRSGMIYECGVFSDPGEDWLVVVTETGPGNHAALSAVTYAHVLFSQFEVQILVGIGGSLKSEDAPIGSVVVSDHVYMPYGGKFAEGTRSGRPRTFPVDQRLIQVARKVCRDKIWPTRIRAPEDGSLPSTDAYPTDFPPIGLVAPIASVEAVLADPQSELAELIADDYGDTRVVEMEGYGAVYAASRERVPSILVRGVSDLTWDKSPETDAARQPVAACHAAAFAFEMLSHWTRAFPAMEPHPPGLIPASTADKPPERVNPSASLNGDLIDLGEVPTQSPLPNTKSTVDDTAAEPVPDVVLVLDEAFPPDLDARVSRIEKLLREIVKSESLKVTGADAGSLRVFVADPLGTLRNFGEPALRNALTERNESDLLGMVEMEECEGLDAARRQLARSSAELMAWPRTLPGGDEIVRPELELLLDRVKDSTTSTTAILGAPGAGKSALLGTLAHRAIALGWPVLAIKGDLLAPDISSEEGLQSHLALDELPAVLLRRLAKLQPTLLILDQLDALAGYLDLRTSRLSTLLNLVRKVGGTDDIHIVLSSRTFEFEHDVRLKAVSAEALTLELPAWSDILVLLEAHNVHAAGWPPDAQEVMRTPQALATYLRLAERQAPEPFTNYQAMLDYLWNERVLVGDDAARRGLLATQIAESMANEESLRLATARFDDRVDDIVSLEAAGVLARSDGSIAFTHQTLFEYALARSFSRQKGRLSAYVMERQISLFLRPKLWAGLTYLRSVDRNTYHFELEAIWTTPDLRPHLRRLLIDFLGHQAYPTDREALVMERAFDLPDQRWPAYQALSGSPGWFERFGPTFVADSMSESDESADHITLVLSRAWSFAEDEVTRLLLERWASHPHHDLRSWQVLGNAARWTSETLKLACTIIRRTEMAVFSIDHVAAAIGVEQPEYALHLVRAHLGRQLALAQTTTEEHAKKSTPEFHSEVEEQVWRLENDPRRFLEKLIEQESGWETLPTLAEQEPSTFLEILWPWFEQYFDALKAAAPGRQGRLGYALNLEADFRFEQEPGMDLPPLPLLFSLQTAAESLARTAPDAWLNWVETLAALDMAPAQRLVAHTFATEPERFSVEALIFLLEDPRRYMLGSLHDFTGTSSRLVRTASDHWSEHDIARFEAVVNDFRPPAPTDLTDPDSRRDWYRYVRQIKLDMLRVLPRNRLTAKARRHIEEEERVFPDRRLGVHSSGVQVVRSVMDAAQIARASDEDVVNAFRTLPDATGWDHPRRFTMEGSITGGNIHLSREFATFAKEDPERAIRLIGSLEPENATRAAGYALEAMAEQITPAQVLQLLLEIVQRGFDGDEFRVSVGRAVSKLIGRGVAVGDDVVALLDDWLANPIANEAEIEDADLPVDGASGLGTGDAEPEDQDDDSHVSLLWGIGAFSIVSGGDYPVLEALIRIRLAREDFDQLDRMLRNYLERNRDSQLWEHVLYFLPGLHPAEPVRKAAILELLFTEVPELVGSKLAAYLLGNSYTWSADFADTQLDRWRDAGSRRARQAYGEIVAVASVMRPDLAWAQERLRALIENHALVDARAGAALTAGNLWKDTRRRSSANDLLTRLLRGGDAGVWGSAFEVFRLVDELRPDADTVALLTTIAERISDAPRLDATFVVERLATLLPHHASLVGRVAEGLISVWRNELGDIRTGMAMAAPQLVDLAVTLHRLGPETCEIGTRLFEQLIEVDAWEARQTLDQIDNRFLEQAPRRPRLARRSRARRRAQRRSAG